MKDIYVQAVVANLVAGNELETVLSNLKVILERRGHTRLYPTILSAVAKTMEERRKVQAVTVTVATVANSDSDLVTKLVAELGASAAERRVVIDENCIGGAKVVYASRQLDATYKTALHSLYKAITN